MFGKRGGKANVRVLQTSAKLGRRDSWMIASPLAALIGCLGVKKASGGSRRLLTFRTSRMMEGVFFFSATGATKAAAFRWLNVVHLNPLFPTGSPVLPFAYLFLNAGRNSTTSDRSFFAY